MNWAPAKIAKIDLLCFLLRPRRLQMPLKGCRLSA
jgi:hypothetical protein